MQVKFEPRRLRQARAMRRMTLADVGSKTELTRQSLSQFENGDRTPAPETLFRIAEALDFPIEFFSKGFGEIESRSRSLVHYRSLRRTRESILDQQRASAVLDMAAAVMDSLEEYIEYQDATVPKISDQVDPLSLSGDDVEEVANNVRRELGIGNGPISDIVLLLENRSIAVMHYPLPDGMDGLSAYYGNRPFVVVSSGASPARSRLNVAHEFGHLVLHENVSDGVELDFATFKLVEDQAWRFAGAFMLPEESFLRDVYNTSLDALVQLKKKWGFQLLQSSVACKCSIS
ncbi:helix-turn-helix domain-containing protein [Lysobacter enzymogenes]|uniref:helix-turn-helix domain-containing protein n=1 Tax=Lysobacter enzymogenes TaxID=69 RepID=UPI002264637D|nr:XRE family transcriptional regulator [Lysobacter enzymogenes]UZW61540.1 XRE family transcriptional regulator [Lysobacter enzymogenes]